MQTAGFVDMLTIQRMKYRMASGIANTLTLGTYATTSLVAILRVKCYGRSTIVRIFHHMKHGGAEDITRHYTDII